MTDAFTLVIGTKNYSSWSLRPWLILKHGGIAFQEELIELRRPETKANIRAVSPSGTVPVLRHGETTVWESLAIAEYLAELCPDKHLWPRDRAARAWARAVSAEMASGFRNLRMQFPMDIINRLQGIEPMEETRLEIDRIEASWSRCLKAFGGPFLFGDWTIADAMYAPVVTRLRTYGIALADPVPAYMAAVLADPFFQDWEADCAPHA